MRRGVWQRGVAWLIGDFEARTRYRGLRSHLVVLRNACRRRRARRCAGELANQTLEKSERENELLRIAAGWAHFAHTAPLRAILHRDDYRIAEPSGCLESATNTFCHFETSD